MISSCRHALAVHQLLGGDVEPALETWLDMMRDHRSYKDDLARRSLVLAFELIGEADPIVAQDAPRDGEAAVLIFRLAAARAARLQRSARCSRRDTRGSRAA